MANMLLIAEQLSDEEQIAADIELRAANRQARKLGLRSTCSGRPYVQALGPVRPIVLPFIASRRSRHIPLREALGKAVSTGASCQGLGGISSINAAMLKAAIFNGLTPEERTVLCILAP